MPSKYIDTFKELEDLMDCKQNFYSYREELKKYDFPAFPYFGIFLRDCTFIDVGNEDFADEEKIFVNFEKMKMKGDVIRIFQRYQQSPYHFPIIHSLQNYLQNLSSFEEHLLHKYSIQYERACDI